MKSITLGNLRLESSGEPDRVDGLHYWRVKGEHADVSLVLSPSEHASILAVAEVVEKAKEWRASVEAVKAEVTYSNALRRDEALVKLRTALDTLTAGGEE